MATYDFESDNEGFTTSGNVEFVTFVDYSATTSGQSDDYFFEQDDMTYSFIDSINGYSVAKVLDIETYVNRKNVIQRRIFNRIEYTDGYSTKFKGEIK